MTETPEQPKMTPAERMARARAARAAKQAGSVDADGPADEAAPSTEPPTWFESREREPYAFEVMGLRPIRNFSTGKLEWEVPADLLELFDQNHFVQNCRVVRKP